MTYSFYAHDIDTARVSESGHCVHFEDHCSDGRADIALFLPLHVSEAVAKTFNRAMQAVRSAGLNGTRYEYRTSSGLWTIYPGNDFTRGIWTFQHDDAEDDAPANMHGTGGDLFDCMDQIDTIIAEDACDECHQIAQDLHEVGDREICRDCLNAEVARQQDMAETADDDRAHAVMEREASL